MRVRLGKIICANELRINTKKKSRRKIEHPGEREEGGVKIISLDFNQHLPYKTFEREEK